MDTDYNQLSWKSKEHIHHEKTGLWLSGLMVAVLMVAGLVFLVSSWLSGQRDYISSIVVLVFGVFLAIMSVKRPQESDCVLSAEALVVNGKEHLLEEYAGYSVKKISEEYEISFKPIKRIGLPITVYCDQQQAEQAMAILDSSLPLLETEHSLFDEVLHRLRF